MDHRYSACMHVCVCVCVCVNMYTYPCPGKIHARCIDLPYMSPSSCCLDIPLRKHIWPVHPRPASTSRVHCMCSLRPPDIRACRSGPRSLARTRTLRGKTCTRLVDSCTAGCSWMSLADSLSPRQMCRLDHTSSCSHTLLLGCCLGRSRRIV
jgi:hypothetical protein